MDKDITSALDAIDKVNPFATYLDNNSLSHVGSWIDTGSYVLNAIISGSIHGGIPKGRVTVLAGESMTGNRTIAIVRCRHRGAGACRRVAGVSTSRSCVCDREEEMLHR